MNKSDGQEPDVLSVLKLQLELENQSYQQRLSDWDTNDSKAARTLTLGLALVTATSFALQKSQGWLTKQQAVPGLLLIGLGVAASTWAQWPRPVPRFTPSELSVGLADKTEMPAYIHVLSCRAGHNERLDGINKSKTDTHKFSVLAIVLGACTIVLLKVTAQFT